MIDPPRIANLLSAGQHNLNYFVRKRKIKCVKCVKVVGAVELKEGTTVDILTGTNKGQVAIYKATILKVCGEHKLRYSLRDRDLIKE